VLTVLDGKPKTSGKTTFLAHLLAQVLRGNDFLGEPTTITKVVVLTEERPLTFRRVLERARLLDAGGLYVRFREDGGPAWRELAPTVVDDAVRIGAGLLIVDTLGAFSPGYENSPNSINAALRPLQDAARRGLAVLAVRHERKSGGSVGDSGLGATAMTAGVDVVLALQRPPNYSGSARKLCALSRFEETPEEIAIELHDGVYARTESLDPATEQAERAVLAQVGPGEHSARTVEEIGLLAGFGRTQCRDLLARLHAKGSLLRVGAGTKGNALRYYRTESASLTVVG
jgi:hypothetical protein